jgi:predicted transcriptional regulator
MLKKNGDVKFAQISAESRFVGATIDVLSLSEAGRTMAVWEVRELARDVYRILLDRVKVEGLMGPRGYLPTELTSTTKIESPAVSVAQSIHPEHLVCLVCGRKFETLTRHIWSSHSLSDVEYRKRFGLDAYYPMASRRYREMRARIADERHASGWSADKIGAASPAGKPLPKTRQRKAQRALK